MKKSIYITMILGLFLLFQAPLLAQSEDEFVVEAQQSFELKDFYTDVLDLNKDIQTPFSNSFGFEESEDINRGGFDNENEGGAVEKPEPIGNGTAVLLLSTLVYVAIIIVRKRTEAEA